MLERAGTKPNAGTLEVSARNATKIEFIQGSFLDLEVHDWTDADVVLTNSVCFSASMMMKLSELGSNLKPGSIFITSNTQLSKPPLPWFTCQVEVPIIILLWFASLRVLCRLPCF